MSKTDKQLLVSIDAGDSKAHIRVESVCEHILLVDKIIESTRGANFNDVRRAGALFTLVETETALLGQVAVVIAGVHGNDHPQQEAALSAPLAAGYPLVRMLNDSHLLILAYGKRSGTGVIAGMDSSVTATIGDSVIIVGGWGWTCTIAAKRIHSPRRFCLISPLLTPMVLNKCLPPSSRAFGRRRPVWCSTPRATYHRHPRAGASKAGRLA